MKEIIELNQRVLEEAGGRLPERPAMIGRDEDTEEMMRLPVAVWKEVEQLRHAINRVLPDDFSYHLFLGNDHADLMIEYHDGPGTGTSVPHDWQDDRSLIQQMRELDWSAERAQAITNCQLFDQMAADAKHLPSRLPSTKELQKAFRDETKAFLKAKRKLPQGVHVLMCHDMDGLKEESFASPESFRHDLRDIMTVHLLVIAVVVNGKPLARGQLELWKKKAIKELDGMPISQAKALMKI